MINAEPMAPAPSPVAPVSPPAPSQPSLFTPMSDAELARNTANLMAMLDGDN